MRFLRFLGAFPAVSLAACTIHFGPQVRGEVQYRQEASSEGIRSLLVDNTNGSITVVCDPEAKDIEILAKKYASGPGLSKEEAQRLAEEEVRIEAARDESEPGRFLVKVVTPKGSWGRSYGATLKISMPPGAAMNLETVNGAVEVKGARNEVVAETTNGAITLTDIQGDIRAETTNGGIEARDTSGSADLETINGSIRLQAASVPERPRIRTSTTNGSVHVELPTAVNAILSMETVNGKASVEVEASVVKDLTFKNRTRSARAVLNNGGGTVEISSTNGSVSFKTR